MKLIIIRLARWALRWVPNGLISARSIRRVELAYLSRTDSFAFRVEQLRELGATIGDNCRLFPFSVFSEPSLVDIGNNVIITGEVILLTHDGAVHTLAHRIPNINGHYGRISIGDNTFVGFRAMILPNTSIGKNCIIGAGAVVRDSFPDNCVIMGNPARAVFSTSLYETMMRHSPYTIADEDYPFPNEYPRELLDERIKTLPIRSPRPRLRKQKLAARSGKAS